MPTMAINAERDRFFNSFLVFLCSNTNGKISKVVKNNRKNAIDNDGTPASCNVNMNIAANETDVIETNSATYGLLFINNIQYMLSLEVIFDFLTFQNLCYIVYLQVMVPLIVMILLG